MSALNSLTRKFARTAGIVTLALSAPGTSLAEQPGQPAQPAAVKSAERTRLSAEDLYQQMLKSSVWIRVQIGNNVGGGSGWIVDKQQKLILTNHHVVDGGSSLFVNFPTTRDGLLITDPAEQIRGGKFSRGKVIDSDKQRDLALIQVESIPDDMAAAPIAKVSPKPTSKLHACGGQVRGSEALWVYNTGIAKQIARRTLGSGQKRTAIESDIPINKGNSGGAIYNDFGEVVAVSQVAVDLADKQVRLTSWLIDVTELNAYLGEALPLVECKTAAQYEARGLRQTREGRYDLAARDFTTAIKLEPRRVTAFIGRGNCFLFKGDSTTAMGDFDKAIEIDPTDSNAYLARGQAFRQQAKYKESLSDITSAIRNAPGDYKLYNQRGVTHHRAKDYVSAETDFTRSLELNATSDVVHANRGEALAAQGKYDEAFVDFKHASELSPENDDYVNMMGICHYRVKNFKAAAAAFAKACELNQRNAVYPTNLGDALMELGASDDAIKAYGVSIELNPKYPTAYLARGKALRKTGAPAAAMRDLNQAITLNPKNAAAWNERGLAAQELGQIDRANADFAEAAKLDPATYGNKTVPASTTSTSAKRFVPQANSLVGGTWQFKGTVNGNPLTSAIVFGENGSYSQTIKTVVNGQERSGMISGQYEIRGNKLHINAQDGVKEFEFELRFGELIITFSDAGRLTFTRYMFPRQ